MHIVMVMVGGLVQLGVFLIFGWHWGTTPAAMATAAKLFLPVLLVVVAVNMWVGVAHAGYSVKDELPILLANFLVPGVVAIIAAWQLSRAA